MRSTRSLSRSRLCAWTLLALCGLGQASSAPLAAKTELLLQAGFITKFPAFVTWPAAVEKHAGQRFTFCVYGPAPVASHIAALLPLTPIEGEAANLRTVTSADELLGCQLLFVPQERFAQDFASLRQGIANRPILTVSNAPDAAEQGAHIGLARSGERLAFDVNREAFEDSGLGVSFRLLEMARSVR